MIVGKDGLTLEPDKYEVESSTESIIKRFKEYGVKLHIGQDVTIDFQTIIKLYHNVFFDGVKWGQSHPNLGNKK